VADDPIVVAGKLIRSPEANPVKAPLGDRKKLNARSGETPITLNEKLDGWLLSVKLMDKRLETLFPVAGRYWIVKEVVVLVGERVIGSVGKAATAMAVVPGKETPVIVAVLAPV
jgi:hypothetical protein